MSDQDRNSESPYKRNSTFLVVGILALGLAGGFLASKAWKKKSAPALLFKESKVLRGDLRLTVQTTGTVQPENRVEIKPPIPGRIETVLVKEGQKVAKGKVLAWMSSTERAALLDAARAKGPDELKRWEEMYRSTPILAPITGTIIIRGVESGQTVTSSDAVLVLSDRLTVKAQVDETDMAQIQVGQQAEIVLDAYSKEKIRARVDRIAYDARTVNNVTTYIVDVLPLETPEFMRSGMTANVTFTVSSRNQVLWVPSEAVRLNESGKSSIYAQTEGNSEPIEVAIQTGITDGKRTEVIEGLKEEQKVYVVTLSREEKKLGKNPLNPMGGRGAGKPGKSPKFH
jgi:macrolide-specific efflux system membrane fusion protein